MGLLGPSGGASLLLGPWLGFGFGFGFGLGLSFGLGVAGPAVRTDPCSLASSRRGPLGLKPEHQPFHAVYAGPYPGLDYRAARPFERWHAPHLLRSMKDWLHQNPPRLELATLALEELRRRGEPGLQAEMLFVDRGLGPVTWLEDARQALAAAFPKSWEGWSQAKRRGGTVYAILRDGYTEQNAVYGVYVGSTKRSLEQRFMEHRQSSKSGRGLQAHGIEPLFSLSLPLRQAPLARAPLRAWETRLHKALETVVPRVSGDVLAPDATP